MDGKRIVLGVTGGIAAYKAADLVRRLRERGAEVQCVLTDAACEFVTPMTFQALSGRVPRTGLWDPNAENAMGHIELARWADVVRNLRLAVHHPQRHAARRIGINMTVFAANLDGVFAMGAFAAGLGVDYLSILHGDGLEVTRARGQQLERGHASLVDQLDRIRHSFPWLHLNDYATSRTLPALPAQTQPGRSFCGLPWRQIDVGPDGHAHPCCRSYGIDLGTAGEAWTGEPLRELRRQILNGTVDAERFGACARCPNLGVGDRAGVDATTSPARRVIPLRVS